MGDSGLHWRSGTGFELYNWDIRCPGSPGDPGIREIASDVLMRSASMALGAGLWSEPLFRKLDKLNFE